MHGFPDRKNSFSEDTDIEEFVEDERDNQERIVGLKNIHKGGWKEKGIAIAHNIELRQKFYSSQANKVGTTEVIDHNKRILNKNRI